MMDGTSFEHLTHPVLGTLDWFPQYSHWFSQPTLANGLILDLIIDPGEIDRFEFLPRAAELFQWSLVHECEIRTVAVKSYLLEMYNEVWRDEKWPELSAIELTNQLDWTFLKVSSCDLVPVVFAYVGLEAPSSLDVQVGGDMQYRGVSVIW